MLPQYSGGLGILAGDHLKAASDLGVPIIGVGLLYGAGYFRQSLSRDGWQLEQYPSLDPQGLPITALHDADGAPTRVAIALPESRTLHAQVWVAQVGRVPLLLLDSNIEENDADARQVTDRLYGGGAEHRLEQELLLGVGGVRAIRAYCAATGAPAPEVFHTNEGHAGFLGVERIRELRRERATSPSTRRCRPSAPAPCSPRTPRSRRHRPLLPRPRRRAPHRARRQRRPAVRAHPRARRRGGPVDLQHGAHGPAARPARQRRLAAARRGQPRHVRRPVAGLRRGRRPDHLGHQRRARPDLDVARHPRHRRARGRRGRPGLRRWLGRHRQGRRPRAVEGPQHPARPGSSPRSAAACTPRTCSAG